MAIKVSVIVPVYRVEHFISRCADSLFEQTLQEVEYIFVDDASPDKSMDALALSINKHPQCQRNVSILHHEKNKGLPSARNTGLAVAKGEYIFHCDSDDFVDRNMLEELYKNAVRDDLDIVWCDWYLSLAHSERYMVQPSFNNPTEAVKAMLSGSMKFNVWNKLVKRDLYIKNNIKFPDGYGMGEDMTMIMLFAYAAKVAHLPKAFYHYVKTNANAFSQTYSDRHLVELKFNVNRMENFIDSYYGRNFNQEIAFMKLEAKFPFLLSGDSSKFKLWKRWYPEANRYILQNKQVSMRSRLLQWCAAKGYWLPVKCYRWVFNHIIYSVICR